MNRRSYQFLKCFWRKRCRERCSFVEKEEET